MATRRIRKSTTTNVSFMKGSTDNGKDIIRKTSAIKVKESATPDQLLALGNAIGEVLNYSITDINEYRLDVLVSQE